MHARVVLGVRKGVLFRKVSSLCVCLIDLTGNGDMYIRMYIVPPELAGHW